MNASEVAAEANREHRATVEAAASSKAHAVNAGRALGEARRLIGLPGWESWLSENFRGSRSRAARYARRAADAERRYGP